MLIKSKSREVLQKDIQKKPFFLEYFHEEMKSLSENLDIIREISIFVTFSAILRLSPS